MDPVVKTSPSLSTMPDGSVHSSMVTYSWVPSDPLFLTVRFTVAINSVPVTVDEFPQGLRCANCDRSIPWGQQAITVGEFLCCIGCSHSGGAIQLEEDDWQIGLQLFLEAIEDRADRDEPRGDVRIYRPTRRELMIVVSQAGHHMKTSVPLVHLLQFLKDVNIARKLLDPLLDAEWIDNGLIALEAHANVRP